MAVEVETHEYEFAHGKRPRGTGCWAFFFGNQTDVAFAFFHSGSYGESKKAAVAEAKRRGATRVRVGS